MRAVHDVAVLVFDLGAEGFGEDLPVGLAVEVGGGEAAEAAARVGEGDAPVTVEKENGVGELFEEGVKL